jgi:DNA-binding response OmpR family regulator
VTPHALVIDDDKLYMLLVCRTLEREGWHVDVAVNGRAGMALLRERSYDAVVTDIIMPEQEGIETIRAIRREFPKIRIVAMSSGSGRPDLDYLQIARAFGAHQTIEKPFTPGALCARVRAALAEGDTDHPSGNA